MKKEFKAPIVDVKELTALNNVMADGAMFISGTEKKIGFTIFDEEVSDKFKQWKGIK